VDHEAYVARRYIRDIRKVWLDVVLNSLRSTLGFQFAVSYLLASLLYASMDPEKHPHTPPTSEMDTKEIYPASKETTTPGSSSESDVDYERSGPNLKKVQHKVDRKLLAWYCFVYLIMRIHVSNITNTAIINEETHDDILDQLNLSSGQWAWVLSIFYYPYAAFEPASTLLLKRFKPNIWMSRIMVT
jgi:hypothetical protein